MSIHEWRDRLTWPMLNQVKPMPKPGQGPVGKPMSTGEWEAKVNEMYYSQLHGKSHQTGERPMSMGEWEAKINQKYYSQLYGKEHPKAMQYTQQLQMAAVVRRSV
ncbi:hypothetical protein AAVH_18626 [Aphelenchoides avenae]|nr:hypothetical protein AAVH_18626 [Aphelenchus avenae]